MSPDLEVIALRSDLGCPFFESNHYTFRHLGTNGKCGNLINVGPLKFVVPELVFDIPDGHMTVAVSRMYRENEVRGLMIVTFPNASQLLF